MQAVILAAGKGSRLHPITTTRSKAMLPILGKPIVERVMEGIALNGIRDFILVVSPDDLQITRYFHGESRLDADVRFVHQPDRRGSADALRCAAPLIAGDFVLSACDNLISPQDIAALLAAWHQPPRPSAVLTLMSVPPEQVPASGIVALHGDTVVRIVEKPRLQDAPSHIASLPLYCLPHALLDYLPEVLPSPRGEYELQDALQLLIQRQGGVRGLMVEARLTLTSPTDLLQINRHFLIEGGEAPHIQPQSVGAGTQLIPPLYIEAGVTIGAGCRIGPNVYIERDCRIGDGAAIQDAVLLCEAVVPPGAVIRHQVVT
jgi:NDP-sugar pyrophosphorylase family protein